MSGRQKKLKFWVTRFFREALGFKEVDQFVDHLLKLNSGQGIESYLNEVLGDIMHSKEGIQFREEFFKRRGLSIPQKQEEIEISKEKALANYFGSGNLKGSKNRTECNCGARSHPLFSNCTVCGRIICIIEGEGDCFFCGSFVLKDKTISNEAFLEEMRNLINANEIQNNTQTTSSKKEIEGLNTAIKRRDVLLQREKARSNKVIDDQGDYFELDSSQNIWADEEDKANARKIIQKRREKDEKKGAYFVDIDFSNRNGGVSIRKEDPDFSDNDEFKKEVSMKEKKVESSFYVNDTLSGRAKEVYESLKKLLSANTAPNVPSKRSKDLNPFRIRQDAEDEDTNENVNEKKSKYLMAKHYDEKSSEAGISDDRGFCLSMHQPWASLLIYGIKKLEGRTWKSDHRGILWIHAASKKPTEEEISDVENQCREYYGDNIRFPTNYPTSALLGCVYVEDCLSQEEQQNQRSALREKGILEESPSEYVFVCSKPHKLLLPQQMSGDRKIWKLPKRLLPSLRSGLVSID